MSTVSSLLVNFVAKTAAFERPVKNSQKTLGGFASFAKTSLATAAKGFAILGGAALGAGTALAFPIKGAMGSIDKIAKMSTELDISTQALAGWEHAAKITGASLPDLHKGLQIMVRRLGEAQQGTGEARKGLEMLGLSADELSKMNGEQQFELLADRISKLPDVTSKASAAYSLFGRQGMNMLNTLNLGADGFAEMRAEADKLGITFDAIDARGVENANDSVTRLKAVLGGVIQKLAISLAPYIELVSDYFVGMGTNAGSSSDFIKDKVSGVVKVLGWVVKGVNLIRGVWNGVVGVFQKGFSFIYKGVELVFGAIAKAADYLGMDGIAGALNDIANVADTLDQAFDDSAKNSFANAGEKFGKAFNDNMESEINKKLAINAKKLESSLEKTELPITLTDEMKDNIVNTTKPEDIGVKASGASKSASAMTYNSSLIDVTGLGSTLKDKDKEDQKKNRDANIKTAFNTERLVKSLDDALIM